MKAIKKIITIIILLIVISIGFYNYGLFKARDEYKNESRVVTSQMILDKIQDRYFLVTKTILWNGEVEVILDNAAGWKEIFSKDRITAQGDVRVDVGLDLDYFTANDIVIDHVNKNVVVYAPKAEILDASVKNDINVQNETGLWTGIKDFFSSDKENDYNIAAKELIYQAEVAVNSDEQNLIEARESGIKLIELTVDSYLPDYKLEIKDK